MNLAISNLAWEGEKSLSILQELNVSVETVFSKIGSWEDLDKKKIQEYKKLLDDYNLKTFSVQSIFYGTKFSPSDFISLSDHCKRVIEFSDILGINTIVFGSPNLRKDKSCILKVLTEIDNYLPEEIDFCIEPNCKLYQGDFFFTLEEIFSTIHDNSFKRIKAMIDTHNMIHEREDIFLSINNPLVQHVHVSEAGLMPLTNFNFHKVFSSWLKSENYTKTVTLELSKSLDLKKDITDFLNIYR